MGLEELLLDLERVMKNKRIRSIVESRVKEFEENKREGDNLKWFEELILCILTANSSAKIGLKCVEALKKNNLILNGSEGKLEEILKKNGHRYYQIRAKYIVEARKYGTKIKDIIMEIKGVKRKREWLVKNIRGIGMKEASHFLRNVGFFEVAIIDRHILKILIGYNLIDPTLKKKTLTVRRYLKIENLLRQIGRKVGLKPGILDLYLWYMSTGKILK